MRACFVSHYSGRGLLSFAVTLVALALLQIEAGHDISAAEAMGEFLGRAGAALRAVFVIQTKEALIGLRSGIDRGGKRDEAGKKGAR